MILLIAWLTLSAAETNMPDTLPTPGRPTRCTPYSDRVARPSGSGKAGPRTLNDMPAAEPYLTVWRSVDGCPVPTKARAEVARRR